MLLEHLIPILDDSLIIDSIYTGKINITRIFNVGVKSYALLYSMQP